MEIIIVLIGLIIGSFLNVCIYRLPVNQSIIWPGSSCQHCGQRLKWWQLLPVLSYLFLKGRCAYCSGEISFRYPLVELLNGFLYILIYFQFGISWLTLTGWLFASILIVISFIDLDHYIIPNEIVAFAALICLPLNFLSENLSWIEMAIGFLVGGGSLLLVALVSRGGMGGGDIKMMAAMGMFLGWQKVLVAIFIASLLGAIVGVILMTLFNKGRKDPVPFGPFLAIGTLLMFLYSNEIFTWYWYTVG